MFSVCTFEDGAYWDDLVTPEEKVAQQVVDDFNRGEFDKVPHAYHAAPTAAYFDDLDYFRNRRGPWTSRRLVCLGLPEVTAARLTAVMRATPLSRFREIDYFVEASPAQRYVTKCGLLYREGTANGYTEHFGT